MPEPRSIFSAVHKLPPAHVLSLQHGQRDLPSPRAYWEVPFNALPPLDEASAVRELVERLREAVQVRQVAEVPLGAFLSGGVDSSAVVAMMAGLSHDPVRTCSIAFADPAYDESRYAQQVAQRYGTDHYQEQVDSDDFALLDRLGTLYDEPFADSSALPTYRVCELARRKVVVALSGDGGDENLAGYRRYRHHLGEDCLRRPLPLSLRRPLFGALANLYPKADWAPRVLRAKATFQALARDSVEGYFQGVSILRDELRAQLFSPNFRRELQGYNAVDLLREHAARAPVEDSLSLVQYLDIKTYLPGDILTKVDRASMAHALEVRVPILDHPLVEWISGLPPDLKLRGGEGKYLFKKAMEPYCRTICCIGARRALQCRWRSGSAGRCGSGCASRCLGERISMTRAVRYGRFCSNSSISIPTAKSRSQPGLVVAADVRSIFNEGRRQGLSLRLAMKILHVLDHSIPLHSGYTFRTAAILREQHRLGWETLHLTSPKQGDANGAMEQTVDGLHFYRTPYKPPALPGIGDWLLMAALTRRLEDLARSHAPGSDPCSLPGAECHSGVACGAAVRDSHRLRGPRLLGGCCRRSRHQPRKWSALPVNPRT